MHCPRIFHWNLWFKEKIPIDGSFRGYLFADSHFPVTRMVFFHPVLSSSGVHLFQQRFEEKMSVPNQPNR